MADPVLEKEIGRQDPNDTEAADTITPTPESLDHGGPSTPSRDNVFLIFITLAQLVQMIPLGAGINSGLVIGEALGGTQLESVWVVASYALTLGSFVLIGMHTRAARR